MSEHEGTAADFAALLAGTPAPSTSPDVSSSPAEPTPEPTKQEADAAWASALFAPKPNPLAAALGLVRADEPERQEQETPAQEAAPPDFDGGVRELMPGPSDPEAEHNQLIADLFRNTPSGGGGQW